MAKQNTGFDAAISKLASELRAGTSKTHPIGASQKKAIAAAVEARQKSRSVSPPSREEEKAKEQKARRRTRRH
jgi:hypothetical protein